MHCATVQDSRAIRPRSKATRCHAEGLETSMQLQVLCILDDFRQPLTQLPKRRVANFRFIATRYRAWTSFSFRHKQRTAYNTHESLHNSLVEPIPRRSHSCTGPNFRLQFSEHGVPRKETDTDCQLLITVPIRLHIRIIAHHPHMLFRNNEPSLSLLRRNHLIPRNSSNSSQ